MTTATVLLLAVMMLAVASLYSSVGQAGASGYLAAMALMNVEPSVMRPTALALNVIVACVATYKFRQTGSVSWRSLWPFAVCSVPAAFVGGRILLPGPYYRPVVAAALLFAACVLAFAKRDPESATVRKPRVAQAMVAGTAIGFASGLTGVGGGIFLSPLLLFMGWAGPREASGLSAVFILVNSASALAGVLAAGETLSPAVPLWAGAAVTGGYLGAHFGSRHLGEVALRRLLAIVLVVAGLRLALAG